MRKALKVLWITGITIVALLVILVAGKAVYHWDLTLRDLASHGYVERELAETIARLCGKDPEIIPAERKKCPPTIEVTLRLAEKSQETTPKGSPQKENGSENEWVAKYDSAGGSVIRVLFPREKAHKATIPTEEMRFEKKRGSQWIEFKPIKAVSKEIGGEKSIVIVDRATNIPGGYLVIPIGDSK